MALNNNIEDNNVRSTNGGGCAEFQDQLPRLMETGADLSDQPHLQECQYCSDLVADLQYIAAQAKLLLPLHDPSPAVWTNIKGTLTREGLMDEDQSVPGLVKKNSAQARR